MAKPRKGTARRAVTGSAKKAVRSSAKKRARGSIPRQPTKAQKAQKRREAESRADIAREAASRPARIERTWEDGYERVRRHFSNFNGPARLRVLDVRRIAGLRPGSGTPWALVGRYAMPEDVTYPALHAMLSDVQDDRGVDRAFDPQRTARITIVYFGEVRGKLARREYTLAEISPWEVAIARAVARLDPDAPADQSLTARYFAGSDDAVVNRSTLVEEVRIWLGATLFKQIAYRSPR